MTPPDVATGWPAAAARRKARMSLLLLSFHRVLEERIRQQGEAFAEANPEVEVRYAGYSGRPHVAELLVERYPRPSRGHPNELRRVRPPRRPAGFGEGRRPPTNHYHPDEAGHTRTPPLVAVPSKTA